MSDHNCYDFTSYVHCGQLLCYNCYRRHMLAVHGKGTYLHNGVVWMTHDYQLQSPRDGYAPTYNEGALEANKLYFQWLATTMTEEQVAELMKQLGWAELLDCP